MTATKAAATLSVLPSHKFEMEDRKRSLAVDAEDIAPSRKRVKDENGATMRMSDEKEKEVEDYQKDAIMRQMKEYKRQKKDADERLAELQQRSKYHDEHLRALDGWFAQLLDEVRVLASETLPTPPPSATSSTGQELYNSALLFEDSTTFSEHLKARSDGIKTAISDLFGRIPSASPDAEVLRKQLNDLLAKEKEHAAELRRTIDEKDSLYQRLEQAMERYMLAERKLDRAKSSQVLKLEKQATLGGNADAVSPTTSKAAATPKREHTETNGELENGVATAEAEAQRREALAAAEQQKAQLEEIEVENERLTNELSAARTKLASLSDDDYAETSLFKTLKSQHENVIKRINDLEATNVQLREETQKFAAERTSYRSLLDEESRLQTSEIESANARAETDLARIRHTRDQLQSDLAILKSSEENTRVSSAQAKELAEAREMRIAALESQVQRLELQLGESDAAAMDVDEMDVDALKAKLRTLESQYSLLSNELPSMESAWKKTQALASKKIEEISGWEETIGRLNAEKAKADQKYFAAMKAKDMRENELRTLRSQNARSSEIVTQLKDAEAKTKELCANHERQLADAKEALAKIEHQHRTNEQKLKETTLSAEGLKKTVEELKSLVSAKDKENLATAKAKRQAEEDLARCKTKLEDSKKQYDTLKKSKTAISQTSADDWRRVAICPVCNNNLRNTVLKLCGHVFCDGCIKELISNRNRKCPSCSKGFGSNDHMHITLT
ncbi:E3 ubiquitin-protein ligase bre1 [Pseudocercospora fuligena]|uniref:E3 ubiquitin protein ligase n=1 Tax=Pseudocercospora fuligena TaxID=685502 RepID=A0A8H6VJP7_9PEZI|nr:E3 ubiquitin-protein ligase bre1 [Pseudocercospora fuligena]